jgi:trimethylamine-N-oxide reductase cytochrome c-type subunit TorC
MTRHYDGRRRRRWLPFAGLLAASALFGAGALFAMNESVRLSSTDEFCTSACHSMQWAGEAYRKSVHYTNSLGLRAACADCHVPYHTRHSSPLEYLELVAFKTKIGVRDIIREVQGTISTRELWEQERPRLSQDVEQWFKQSGSVTCQQCHDLKAFGGDYSEMTKMVHADLLHADTVNCIKCHKHVGHVYAKKTSPAATPGSQTGPAPEQTVRH